jgi:hypothetical protein
MATGETGFDDVTFDLIPSSTTPSRPGTTTANTCGTPATPARTTSLTSSNRSWPTTRSGLTAATTSWSDSAAPTTPARNPDRIPGCGDCIRFAELADLCHGWRDVVGLFVRWSPDCARDLADENSVDELTLVPLPGLSMNGLAVEPWWEDHPFDVWLTVGDVTGYEQQAPSGASEGTRRH